MEGEVTIGKGALDGGHAGRKCRTGICGTGCFKTRVERDKLPVAKTLHDLIHTWSFI